MIPMSRYGDYEIPTIMERISALAFVSKVVSFVLLSSRRVQSCFVLIHSTDPHAIDMAIADAELRLTTNGNRRTRTRPGPGYTTHFPSDNFMKKKNRRTKNCIK